MPPRQTSADAALAPAETRKDARRYAPRDVVEAARDSVYEFYEAVLRTVRARGLVHELAAGFDVARERGRGRFDLNPPFLPQRDERGFSTKFEALVADDADWKPVLKAVLGTDDVELIASGVFLAMPGAETQAYLAAERGSCFLRRVL